MSNFDSRSRTTDFDTADAHALLVSPHRRAVLDELQPGLSCSLDELTEGVSERVAGEPTVDADADVVRTALWHIHLPKLVDHEVVRHDRNDDTITVGPAAAALEQYR